MHVERPFHVQKRTSFAFNELDLQGLRRLMNYSMIFYRDPNQIRITINGFINPLKNDRSRKNRPMTRFNEGQVMAIA